MDDTDDLGALRFSPTPYDPAAFVAWPRANDHGERYRQSAERHLLLAVALDDDGDHTRAAAHRALAAHDYKKATDHDSM